MPSWPSLAIAFLGPLFIISLAKFVNLAEKPRHTITHFLTGAFLAFLALIAERYVFELFGSFIPAQYRLVIEAFIFVAFMEEVVKIAQIAELARREAATLRDTIAIGIAVAAGFAGAENVVYLFRHSDAVADLLVIRTLTANPLHLGVAVIASSYIFEAIKDEEKLHYLAIAVLIATLAHGFYDYLIMSSGGRSFKYLLVLAVVVSWAWRIAPASKQPL